MAAARLAGLEFSSQGCILRQNREESRGVAFLLPRVDDPLFGAELPCAMSTYPNKFASGRECLCCSYLS
jgi:hypothetical protein